MFADVWTFVAQRNGYNFANSWHRKRGNKIFNLEFSGFCHEITLKAEKAF